MQLDGLSWVAQAPHPNSTQIKICLALPTQAHATGKDPMSKLKP